MNEINSTLSFCLHYAIEELYGFELQQLFMNSKTYFVLMETRATVGYLAPEIEVNEVMIEQGVAASNPSSETMPEIGGENEEIGW